MFQPILRLKPNSDSIIQTHIFTVSQQGLIRIETHFTKEYNYYLKIQN
jgi:hypothetical protein